MNWFHQIIQSSLIQILGIVLLHSLWQFLVLGAIAAGLGYLFRRAGATDRYIIYITTQLLLLATAGLTLMNRMDALPSNNVQGLMHEGATVLSQSGLNTGWIFRLLPFLVIGWVAGIVLLTVRCIGGMIILRRMIHKFCEPVSEHWQHRLDVLRSKLKCNNRIRLLMSREVCVPLTFGWLRPVIVFPAAQLMAMPPEQVDAILLHEIAHVFRKDYFFNLIQNLVEILFFYHPVTWWLSAAIRRERENCCDDIAVQCSGDFRSYAEALLHLGSQKVLKPALAMPATGRRHQLVKRVKRIMEGKKMNRYGLKRLPAISFLIAGMAIVALISTGDIMADDSMDSEAICDHMKKVEVIRMDDLDISMIEDGVNDQQKKLQITLKDGKIEKIMKDGKLVPEEDYYLYEKEIQEMEKLALDHKCCELPDLGDGCKRMEIIKIGDDNSEESGDAKKIKKIICIRRNEQESSAEE